MLIKLHHSLLTVFYLHKKAAINTLKKEAIYYHIYDSATDLAAVLDEYIEYYNEIRMHRTLK